MLGSKTMPYTTDKKQLLPARIRGGGAGVEKAQVMRRVRSSDLLQSNEELVIEHAGREYRLRVTSTGKLILTA